MVFGRRKKKRPDADDGASSDGSPPRKPPAERSASSYRRPMPPQDAVTHTEQHPLTHCQDCGTNLTDLKTVVRYEGYEILTIFKIRGIFVLSKQA